MNQDIGFPAETMFGFMVHSSLRLVTCLAALIAGNKSLVVCSFVSGLATLSLSSYQARQAAAATGSKAPHRCISLLKLAGMNIVHNLKYGSICR